jgi:hypothetical protein
VRNISFQLTVDQVRHRMKTVTRRLGWKDLQPGTLLQPVVKAQGLKKGEKVQKIGGPIRVVSVRREPLDAMTAADCVKEGFGHYSTAAFIAMFERHNRCDLTDIITRIEFEYMKETANG